MVFQEEQRGPLVIRDRCVLPYSSCYYTLKRTVYPPREAGTRLDASWSSLHARLCSNVFTCVCVCVSGRLRVHARVCLFSKITHDTPASDV